MKNNTIKVLLVEDERMLAEILADTLSDHNFEIKQAYNGVMALDGWRDFQPDVIVTDIMMPQMDGIETFRAIKEQHLATNIPIIMLTANAIVGSRERYLQEGFYDFLSKPILPEKLDQILLKHLPPKHIIDNSDIPDTPQPAIPETGTLLERLHKALPEIDTNMGLSICSGDTSFYKELLQDFVVLPIKTELSNFQANQDAANYCIRVHGFKNNAYSIGAKRLGDLAYQLEQLSRNNDLSSIPDLQTQLFAQYDHICSTLNSMNL